MADEKQLTVAELLERNKKAGGSERKPRRRRSLEDGGISVAELTGSFKAVPAAPAQSKHATPIDEGDKATASKASAGKASESAAADKKQTEVQAAKPESAAADKKQAEAVRKAEPAKPATAKAIKKKADDAKTVVAPKVQGAKPESATADSTDLKQADKKTPSNDDTSIITKVKEPQAGSSKLGSMVDTSSHDEPKTAEPKAEVAKPDADPSDEAPVRSNPWAVTLLSIIGIVLGIAVFVVFDALWGGLAKWLVAILALIVTGAAVLVVRVMRTEKDRQSQILAGVAGLAMTFGPALLHLF